MKNKEHWLAFVIILITSIILFSPLFKGPGYYVAGEIMGSDLNGFHYPTKASYAEALHQGKLALWEKDIYTGFPLFAEGQVGELFPLNIILFGLLPLLWAFIISYIAIYTFAGTCTYFLLRQYRLSFFSALFGGLVIMLSGFFLGHLHHLNLLQASAFFPFLLLMLDKYFETKKPVYAVFLSLGILSCILIGHPQILFYNLFFVGVYALYKFLGRIKKHYIQVYKKHRDSLFDTKDIRSFSKFFVILALAITLSLGMGAIQILPTLELRTFSNRNATYSSALTVSKNLSSYYFPFSYTNNYIEFLGNEDPAEGKFSTIPGVLYQETTAYVGIPAILLSLVALFFLIRKKEQVSYFFLTGFFSFLLSLGLQTSLIIFLALPGFNLFRVPARFILYADFSLAVLSAFGLFYLEQLCLKILQKWDIKKAWIAKIFLISIFTIVCVLYFMIPIKNFWHINPVSKDDSSYFSPITQGFIRNNLGDQRIYSTQEISSFYDIYLQNKGWSDLQPYVENFNLLGNNQALLVNLPSANGYAGLSPERIYNLVNDIEDSIFKISYQKDGTYILEENLAFHRFAQILGIKYLLSPYVIEDDSLKLIYQTVPVKSPNPAYIYEYNNPLPHAFIVPKAEVVTTAMAAYMKMYSSDFQPSSTIILEKYIEPERNLPYKSIPDFISHWGEPINKSEVKTIENTNTSVRLKTASDRNGFLFLSDLYYPGWNAYLDNVEVPIYRANYAFRAILLPRGSHEVIFKYEPESFKTGLYISIFSVILFSITMIYATRKFNE